MELRNDAATCESGRHIMQVPEIAFRLMETRFGDEWVAFTRV